MQLAQTLLAFVVALGVLVVVHELGHLLIARLCGVKVLKFSVGFGKAVWSRRFGPDQTEWALAPIPLGGYVKMLDEREAPVAGHELHRAFNRKNVWQRVAIVSAGPIANFLFAIVAYWALFMNGVPEAKPVLAAPSASSIAAGSGLKSGDLVRALNDEPVQSWQDLRWKLLKLAVDQQPAKLEVQSADQKLSWVTLDFSTFRLEGRSDDPMSRIGLGLYRPDLPPVIGDVIPGGVADRAGLRAGDRIARVDGQAMPSWERFVQVIRARVDQDTAVEVEREGGVASLTLRPEASRDERDSKVRVGRIGARPQVSAAMEEAGIAMVSYGPLESLWRAGARTWDTTVFSLRLLGKMLVGQISPTNLSGPVAIADYAGQSAQMGIAAYVSFLALISISLGLLNLLPVPVLDGGHLMYYAIEIIKGSPLPERAMEFGQRVGLALLIGLMALAFYNDINHLIPG